MARYAMGAVFAIFAVGLIQVGSVFAVIPAVVSVYILGSLLWEVLKDESKL